MRCCFRCFVCLRNPREKMISSYLRSATLLMILIAWCSACRYCLLLFYSPVVIVDVHDVESCLFPFMYVIVKKKEMMFLVFFSVFERDGQKITVKSVKSVSNNHSQSVGRVQAWRIQFSYIRYTSVWRCLAVTGGVWRCLAVCWRCKRVEERPFTSQSKEFYTYSPRILYTASHRQPPPDTARH